MPGKLLRISIDLWNVNLWTVIMNGQTIYTKWWNSGTLIVGQPTFIQLDTFDMRQLIFGVIHKAN